MPQTPWTQWVPQEQVLLRTGFLIIVWSVMSVTLHDSIQNEWISIIVGSKTKWKVGANFSYYHSYNNWLLLEEAGDAGGFEHYPRQDIGPQGWSILFYQAIKYSGRDKEGGRDSRHIELGRIWPMGRANMTGFQGTPNKTKSSFPEIGPLFLEGPKFNNEKVRPHEAHTRVCFSSEVVHLGIKWAQSGMIGHISDFLEGSS